jgi:protein-serine/threonine kinase
MRRSGAIRRVGRWFKALGEESERADASTSASVLVDRNRIVMAAVDIDNAAPLLLDQLREAVRRVVLTEPGARLACVSVMRTARIGMDDKVDSQGQSVHVKQLVALKHWARPIGKALGLEDGRITFHVLEAPDAAAAIIDFAQRNQADHIVMGARGRSALRRYLGSVSSQVVAQSECTVTVVRAPGGEEPPPAT